MVLSKRERYIVIGVAAAVGILTLDHFVWSPYVAERNAIDADMTQVRSQQDEATILFDRKRKLTAVWTEMQKGGLKVDPSQAESQALHAVLDWAQSAGITLASLKPERSTQEGKFQVISFSATGTGPMPAISRLMWALETARIPVRVNDVQITPRKEGTDDLSVRLSVSALCLPPEADTSGDSSPLTSASTPDGGNR